MVRVGDWKLISTEHAGQLSERLYDLAADPREQHDLAADRPDRLAALRTLLDRRRAAARAARLAGDRDVELGAESRSVLKALGYVGEE